MKRASVNKCWVGGGYDDESDDRHDSGIEI
jgi:hypothetical protein